MPDKEDVLNPQAEAPGTIEPQRTPGSAPSVVPLPDGADPDSKDGEHPLPEQAIDGYPKVAKLEDEKANKGNPAGTAAASVTTPQVPTTAKTSSVSPKK